MPVISIETIDDPRVATYRDLPDKRSSRGAPHFVVEGRWLVQRLLASDVEVASVLCAAQHAEEFADVAVQLPLLVAQADVLERILGFAFHRGVLACGVRPLRLKLDELTSLNNDRSLVATCVGVRDQENLGSVIRNCQALGVDALLVDDNCANAFSRRVMRVSAGAALTLPIVETPDLERDLHRLRDQWNFTLTGTVLDDTAIPLEQAPTGPKMVILFGAEGYGLEPCWRELADACVTLPMHGGVDSLNVAVASGIFLHHFARSQRVDAADVTRPT